MTTRDDVDRQLPEEFWPFTLEVVDNLSVVPPMYDSSHHMESQSRNGSGYVAYFYEFNDVIPRRSLMVYHLEDEELVNWASLANDISAYLRLMEARNN